MDGERLSNVAATLVAYCRSGQEARGLSELYSPDAVSVEAGPPPGGGSAETRGLDGIRGKHAWWAENFEVHSAGVEGPFLHAPDSFAVIFDIDATHRESGSRQQMREVGVYTLGADGRIIRESFFGRP